MMIFIDKGIDVEVEPTPVNEVEVEPAPVIEIDVEPAPGIETRKITGRAKLNRKASLQFSVC